jgi:hypothetical protein
LSLGEIQSALRRKPRLLQSKQGRFDKMDFSGWLLEVLRFPMMMLMMMMMRMMMMIDDGDDDDGVQAVQDVDGDDIVVVVDDEN